MAEKFIPNSKLHEMCRRCEFTPYTYLEILELKLQRYIERNIPIKHYVKELGQELVFYLDEVMRHPDPIRDGVSIRLILRFDDEQLKGDLEDFVPDVTTIEMKGVF